MDQTFSENRFQQTVDKALVSVRRVLDTNRNPSLPSSVAHTYTDKYSLVESIVRMGISASEQTLYAMGVSDKKLETLEGWKQAGLAVTVRLESEERCAFVKKAERDVERPQRQERTYSSGFKRTDKIIDVVTEYFWNFDAAWKLLVYPGNDLDAALVLQAHSGKCELITNTESTPKPVVSVVSPIECNVAWLLDHNKGAFEIDRSAASCATPRRNHDVEAALEFFRRFASWAVNTNEYFMRRLFPTQPRHGLNLNAINDLSQLFVPVVPLLEQRDDNVLLPAPDLEKFLREEQRTIEERLAVLSKTFKAGTQLITTQEVRLCVLAQHARQLAQQTGDGVNYIESLLHKQLVAAIGKELTAHHFTQYMRWHNQKLFRETYEPRAFAYAVRRPDHYPEAIISIEQDLQDGSVADPIQTVVRHSPTGAPMHFPLGAATQVTFHGQRFLHAWINHQFSGASGVSLSLTARARQFSSCILLAGKLGGSSQFIPKAAVVVRDKDDLSIPLMLETIPAPKEFRDAIASLSPEQQRFAKAYRSMQLASTLFAVVVIQIKPQLEKLLKLPEDGLTKEIQLTRELMELFIEYQLPSDLLSFDELNEPAASDAQRVEGVKRNVREIKQMLDAAKAKEIAEETERARVAAMQATIEQTKTAPIFQSRMMPRSPMPPPSPMSYSSGPMPPPSMPLPGGAPPPSMMMMMSPPPPPGGAPPPAAAPAPAPVVIAAAPADAAPTPPAEAPEVPETLGGELATSSSSGEDYTSLPAKLDAQFEALDSEGALRPTIINLGSQWKRKVQKALLADPHTETVGKERQKELRNEAFDLLDALTRSGSMEVHHASMHVILAATHCFDKTLMQTVVQNNRNAIEDVERSVLITAATIHDKPASELVRAAEMVRVRDFTPALFTIQGDDIEVEL